MITALASALHGHDTFSKGYIMAGHAFAYAGLTFLATQSLWFTAAVFLLCVAFWYTLRSGKNAHLEMQRMDTINEPHPTFMDVVKGHYYTGWLTAWALEIWNYSTERGQKLGWEKQAIDAGIANGWVDANGEVYKGLWRGKEVRVVIKGYGGIRRPEVHPDDRPFWQCRRPAEIATGLTFDILLLIPLIIGALL